MVWSHGGVDDSVVVAVRLGHISTGIARGRGAWRQASGGWTIVPAISVALPFGPRGWQKNRKQGMELLLWAIHLPITCQNAPRAVLWRGLGRLKGDIHGMVAWPRHGMLWV